MIWVLCFYIFRRAPQTQCRKPFPCSRPDIGYSNSHAADTKYVQTLQASAEAFVNRADEDTRTGQLVEFFRNVRISELVLGRGSLATWNWGGVEFTSAVDLGYLSLLFFGGLPLLLTYVALHITPALGTIRRPESEWQRSCAAIALLWALRMFSSSYPELSIEYYPVLLCIGGCLGQARRVSIKRARRSGAGVQHEGPLVHQYADAGRLRAEAMSPSATAVERVGATQRLSIARRPAFDLPLPAPADTPARTAADADFDSSSPLDVPAFLRRLEG